MKKSCPEIEQVDTRPDEKSDASNTSDDGDFNPLNRVGLSANISISLLDPSMKLTPPVKRINASQYIKMGGFAKNIQISSKIQKMSLNLNK